MYCLGPGADNKDSDLVSRLFSSVGLCRRVQESQIGERKYPGRRGEDCVERFCSDAVTGVSGSGPAYMYLILEAMADEGVRQGLDRSTSYQLAAQVSQ